MAVFNSFEDAEKADREFYRKLSGQERLDILLKMTKEVTQSPIERVYRIIKFPNRDSGKTDKHP